MCGGSSTDPAGWAAAERQGQRQCDGYDFNGFNPPFGALLVGGYPARAARRPTMYA